MRTPKKKSLGLVTTLLLCVACAACTGKKLSVDELGPLPRVAGKHEAQKATTSKHAPPPSAAKLAKVAKPASTQPAPTATPVAGLEVKRVVFAKNVVNREPVDTGKTFSHAATSKVWVFLELANATETPITLDVKWEPLDGAPSVHGVQLSIPKSKRWRTQAFISTDKKPGTYRCIIRTAAGAVVLSENVEITA